LVLSETTPTPEADAAATLELLWQDDATAFAVLRSPSGELTPAPLDAGLPGVADVAVAGHGIAGRRLALSDLLELEPGDVELGDTAEAVLAVVDRARRSVAEGLVHPHLEPSDGRWHALWGATLDALALIDLCLARVVGAIETVDAGSPDAPGALLAITADHGNADELRDDEDRPVTAHSLNPVPFVLVGRAARGVALADGALADVAPTLLAFAKLPLWDGITGRSRIL